VSLALANFDVSGDVWPAERGKRFLVCWIGKKEPIVKFGVASVYILAVAIESSRMCHPAMSQHGLLTWISNVKRTERGYLKIGPSESTRYLRYFDRISQNQSLKHIVFRVRMKRNLVWWEITKMKVPLQVFSKCEVRSSSFLSLAERNELVVSRYRL